MKKLTRAQLFAPGQRGPRKTKDWFERAKLIVAAARERAVETTQLTCGAVNEALSYRVTETPFS